MQRLKHTFAHLHDEAESSLSHVSPRNIAGALSIPEQVRRFRAQVKQRFPDMSDQLLVAAIGAVAVYRLRLTDMHLREMVMLLWIVEGDRYMRCHQGTLYFFYSAAFAVHHGVPPHGTLARCKMFVSA